MSTASKRVTVLVAHLGSELYGSDRVLRESVVGLVGGGNRVVVALPSSGPLAAALRECGAEISICASPVLRRSILRPIGLIGFGRDTFRGMFAGSRLIRAVRPDVLLVNTVTIPLWVLLGRAHGLPVIVHVHEAEDSLSHFAQRVLTFPLLFATQVVTNSHYCVSVLAGAYRRLAKTSVIYNGIEAPKSVLPARAALDSALRVLYIGRLSPRKGLDCLLTAIAELKTTGVASTLSVVGGVFPGYEWFEEQLREQVSALRIEDQVTFHGFRSSIWAELEGSDIVVVPSPNESFGNIAIEAILGGRPVVTSDAPGLAEATAGFLSARNFPIGNSHRLSAVLASVVSDWSELGKAAESDTRLARARHSPEGYHRQIVELVTSVASR